MGPGKKIMVRAVQHPAELPLIRAPQTPKPQNPHQATRAQLVPVITLPKAVDSTTAKPGPTAPKGVIRHRH